MKQDLDESPSPAECVKQELKKDLECHKVDVVGILRELNIYKTENQITQKKIEHIYTLIDRLTKKANQ